MAAQLCLKALAGAALVLIATAASAESLALKGFTLIDGTGRAPVKNAAMVVTDGRIAWVGAASAMKAPAGAKPVDLAGKYVMPGLIDTHIHLGLTTALAVDAKNQTPENVERQLQQYARYGVTTVQTMGTEQDVVMRKRDAQRAIARPGEARLYAAGLGVVFDGGYGGLAGVTKKVKTPAEADAAVAREVARNVDIVKFWLDDELGTMPKLPADISKAVIDGAHKRGKRVAAHVFYLEDAKRVVGQGVDSLAHAVRDQPIDAALIADMKRKGTWQQASTLAREEALFEYATPAEQLNDPFFQQSVTPEIIAQLTDPARQATMKKAPHFAELPGFLSMAQRNLKAMSDAGIPFAMGTDSGGPLRFPGYAEHEEMKLMIDAGLTPMQAIVASTASGAKFLRAKDIGTLERGKWADMIVLDADPVADIRNSRAIHAVYIAGRQVPSIKR